jgi:hypothetical protein
MQLSLRQASREAGISKSTLARAVASGRVSATRTDDGRLLFDPAELFRAYPPGQNATESEPSQQPDDKAQSRPATVAEGQDATALATALETEVRLLRERLAEMRQERDEWREQAKTLGSRPLLLAAPETPRDTPQRRWWPFRREG